MSQKFSLRRMRAWPRWTIIPIGLALAGLAVLLGLMIANENKNRVFAPGLYYIIGQKP